MDTAYCRMIEQGYERGSCATATAAGDEAPACALTLRRRDGRFQRLIRSAHLSRPEHYLSVYQSGCNHTCRKCHSSEFSQRATGRWLSSDDIAELARQYERQVTYVEPCERATMYHATTLCRGCGSCVLHGRTHRLCPGALRTDELVLSHQGVGPARNIVAFTGGDIACRADFYAEATTAIKQACRSMWVLIETNGYGLTPENLDLLADAGVDSFWLDIKAYDGGTYRTLCGTSNEVVLRAPAEIMERGFVLEALSLMIPGWVGVGEIGRIAGLLAGLDAAIPFTILAFFPAYELSSVRSPTVSEMLAAHQAAARAGLRNIRLGNLGIFAKTAKDQERVLAAIGREGLG